MPARTPGLVTPNSQSLVNLQDFLSFTNKDGTGTIWTDITSMHNVANLKNQAVLGNVLNRKRIETGENFVFEYQYLPKINQLNVTTPIDASTKKVSMEKVTLNWDQSAWLLAGYTESVLQKRTAYDWASKIAEWEAKMYTSKNDTDNLIALGTLYNYALGSGRYKILPNLDTPIATKEDIYDALTDMLETIASIGLKRTDVSYGQDKRRTQLIVSEFVQINMMKAANFINASDASFRVMENGVLGSFGGVSYNTSFYLGQNVNSGFHINNTGVNYTFDNLLGVVFDIDNFTLFTKPWTELGYNGWRISDADKTIQAREVTWKSMGIITPSREHLNYIILREAPTLEEVNIARATLLKEQKVFYADWKPITNADLTNMNSNALLPRLIAGSDTPQNGRSDLMTPAASWAKGDALVNAAEWRAEAKARAEAKENSQDELLMKLTEAVALLSGKPKVDKKE